MHSRREARAKYENRILTFFKPLPWCGTSLNLLLKLVCGKLRYFNFGSTWTLAQLIMEVKCTCYKLQLDLLWILIVHLRKCSERKTGAVVWPSGLAMYTVWTCDIHWLDMRCALTGPDFAYIEMKKMTPAKVISGVVIKWWMKIFKQQTLFVDLVSSDQVCNKNYNILCLKINILTHHANTTLLIP